MILSKAIFRLFDLHIVYFGQLVVWVKFSSAVSNIGLFPQYSGLSNFSETQSLYSSSDLMSDAEFYIMFYENNCFRGKIPLSSTWIVHHNQTKRWRRLQTDKVRCLKIAITPRLFYLRRFCTFLHGFTGSDPFTVLYLDIRELEITQTPSVQRTELQRVQWCAAFQPTLPLTCGLSTCEYPRHHISNTHIYGDPCRYVYTHICMCRHNLYLAPVPKQNWPGRNVRHVHQGLTNEADIWLIKEWLRGAPQPSLIMWLALSHCTRSPRGGCTYFSQNVICHSGGGILPGLREKPRIWVGGRYDRRGGERDMRRQRGQHCSGFSIKTSGMMPDIGRGPITTGLIWIQSTGHKKLYLFRLPPIYFIDKWNRYKKESWELGNYRWAIEPSARYQYPIGEPNRSCFSYWYVDTAKLLESD